jgi:2-phospho-L-lactate guanylyltransferase
VVPVKRLAQAKSRLVDSWITNAVRAELALAFAVDAVGAAQSVPSIDEVVVVTDDPTAGEALRGLGALVIADKPDAGLNPALAYGASIAREEFAGMGIAALAADLPALRPAELDVVVRRLSADSRSFIPDAHDIGTTMLFAPPGLALDPRFGGPSRAAHTASGAVAITEDEISSLRRDVDTAADLAAAAALGVGPRTSAIWTRRPGCRETCPAGATVVP